MITGAKEVKPEIWFVLLLTLAMSVGRFQVVGRLLVSDVDTVTKMLVAELWGADEVDKIGIEEPVSDLKLVRLLDDEIMENTPDR